MILSSIPTCAPCASRIRTRHPQACGWTGRIRAVKKSGKRKVLSTSDKADSRAFDADLKSARSWSSTRARQHMVLSSLIRAPMGSTRRPSSRIYTVAASFFPGLSACATGPKRFDSLFGLKNPHHVGVGIAARYDQCGVDTKVHCLSSRSRRHGASRPVQRSHTWGVAKRT
jgi:hypothetical protein